MHNPVTRWIVPVVLAMLLAGAGTAHASLVSVDWLRERLGREDMLLIDASSSRLHAAKHIPGAIGVDLYTYGSPHNVAPAVMEQRIQSWGVSAGRRIVIYDEGASMMATWLFFELHYHGVPASDLAILDGGLAKWQASGGPVTNEATPPAPKGTFRVTSVRDDQRVRLAEFVTASGDPAKHALVEALEPEQHFGATKFFDRAGHVPNALMFPVADFFNADKTFKSRDEIRRWPRISASGPSSASTRIAAAASRRPSPTSRSSSSRATRTSASTRNRSSNGCATSADCRSGPTTRRTSSATCNGSAAGTAA